MAMTTPEPHQAAGITGHAAGVPFVALPPDSGRSDAPVVVAWHLLDAPRTERSFASALPLAGLDAWRIYLGLPETGSRAPAGGMQELMQRAADDAVLRVYGPIVSQALQEFHPALAELRDRFGFQDGPLGLLGGSLGAAIAQLVLIESALDIAAAVLVNPVLSLRRMINDFAPRYGFEYRWTEDSNAIADRIDFVTRAAEIAQKDPAVLLIVGGADEAAFREPAEELAQQLEKQLSNESRVGLVNIPDMGHALADEPGTDPAPQTVHAQQVDRLAADWFRRFVIA
jgi:prolyl oligopeptidase family protein